MWPEYEISEVSSDSLKRKEFLAAAYWLGVLSHPLGGIALGPFGIRPLRLL
jgi:hypothetical protein